MTFLRKLEFYEIEPANFNFPTEINAVFRKRLVEHTSKGRILSWGNTSMALTKLEDTTNYLEGLFVRVTTDDIPLKGSLLRNDFQAIPLGVDEGIADMTYFVYIKNLRILCLLPAKNGVKWGSITHYIKTLSGNNDFELLPLLNPNAQAIFNSWRSYTSIEAEIKIGNNIRPTSRNTQALPLNIALDETLRIGSTRLKIELYNPKRKGGLVAQAVRSLGRVIQRLGGECEAKHLKVKGSPDAETGDSIIDIISQKYQIEVRLGRGGRYLDYVECSEVVRQSITRNEQQIRGLID